MIILYVALIVYILAINFYAFLLVKSLKEKERQAEIHRLEEQANPLAYPSSSAANNDPLSSNEKSSDKPIGKLCITGLLGGAITIYVCMFLLKFRRSDLFLMVIMPLLGVLNIYLWVLLFRSGFGFLIIR